MEGILAFAKGPLFAVTVTFMIVGLLRHLYLQTSQVRDSLRRMEMGETGA